MPETPRSSSRSIAQFLPPKPPLTIAHVSLHSCIRAHKIAWAWADEDAGRKVILLSEELHVAHHSWWVYDLAAKLYRDGEGKYQPWQLENAIKMIDPLVDAYHVHNEPDWPVWVIRKHTKKPIIYDLHDLKSIRTGEQEEDEKKAFDACDAISCVSRRYQREAQKYAPLKTSREILSAVPKEFYTKEKRPLYRGGIVYEGGLKADTDINFPCRDWSEVFKEILKLGIQVYAYSANRVINAKKYDGVILFYGYTYAGLMRELSRYEFGLVGSPFPDPMFDGALPNKMFEYMAAGLPMICMNAPDVSDFLAATGMGVTVSSVDEIPGAMEFMRKEKFHEVVWKNRWNWTMETQTGKVDSLYREALKSTPA